MNVRGRVATVAGAALIMAGCLGLSPRSDDAIFLVLAPGTAPVPMPAVARQDLRVGVGPVSIPRYLDRPQFVTRLSATEVAVNEHARWAGPLDRLIAETIVENLNGYLALGAAVIHPWRRSDGVQYGVRLRVLHFEVTAADSATLVAQWEIADGHGGVVLPAQRATFTHAAGRGPTAGAAALSDLLGLLSADIAAALRRLPGEE